MGDNKQASVGIPGEAEAVPTVMLGLLEKIALQAAASENKLSISVNTPGKKDALVDQVTRLARQAFGAMDADGNKVITSTEIDNYNGPNSDVVRPGATSYGVARANDGNMSLTDVQKEITAASARLRKALDNYDNVGAGDVTSYRGRASGKPALDMEIYDPKYQAAIKGSVSETRITLGR